MRSTHVGKWPASDLPECPLHVRYRGQSGHDADWLSLPSLTRSRHERIPPRLRPFLSSWHHRAGIEVSDRRGDTLEIGVKNGNAARVGRV